MIYIIRGKGLRNASKQKRKEIKEKEKKNNKKYLLTLKVENFINSWNFDFLTDIEPESLFVETGDETKYIFTGLFSNWLKENGYGFFVDAVNSNDEVVCSYQIKNLDSLTEIR